MSKPAVKIDDSWKERLSAAFEAESFLGLTQFLKSEKAAGKIIFPPGPLIFEAFNRTKFDEVKVVILGQDPYHGPNQAHGLSFSVNDGVPYPPSLLNILKACMADIPGFMIPGSGNLSKWAERGVLLLNATLTVEAGKAGSHQKKGWEEFTDTVIKVVSEQKEHIVFLLWGAFAQSKIPFINQQKHLVLTAPHPSPLSAHKGFLACQHFSKTNEWLESKGLSPIDWRLYEL
jgi:uracil-DNA glycosylase